MLYITFNIFPEKKKDMKTNMHSQMISDRAICRLFKISLCFLNAHDVFRMEI